MDVGRAGFGEAGTRVTRMAPPENHSRDVLGLRVDETRVADADRIRLSSGADISMLGELGVGCVTTPMY